MPSSQPKNGLNEKRQLLAALSRVCALQKHYGKTAAELETLVDGFMWALAEYPMPEILRAMAEYVRRNSDIPAPADIIKLIEPPKADWKPDWPVYIALKKKVQQDGYYLYGKEREFVKRCDDYAIDRATRVVDPANEDERAARQIATGEKTFALKGPEE